MTFTTEIKIFNISHTCVALPAISTSNFYLTHVDEYCNEKNLELVNNFKLRSVNLNLYSHRQSGAKTTFSPLKVTINKTKSKKIQEFNYVIHYARD